MAFRFNFIMDLTQSFKKSELCISAILLCYTALTILFTTIEAVYHSIDKGSWRFTEFLINYQGGYVRRGLIGEILYFLKQRLNIEPILIIWILCILSSLAVSWILIHQFRKGNLSLWVLPLCSCLSGADFLRKDFTCYLLIAAWLYTYSKKINTPFKLLLINSIGILLFNIHEASFFIVFPFAFLCLLTEPHTKRSYHYLTILIQGIAFGIVILNKGDTTIARKIQDSWALYYPNPFAKELITTIQSIGWETEKTILMHLHENFLRSSFGIQGWFSKPIVWASTFFIIPNLLFRKYSFTYRKESVEVRNFLALLIIQFVSLSPLFFFLSCDPVRILSYWTISTFLIYTFIPDKIGFCYPVCLRKITERVQQFIFFRQSLALSIAGMFFLCISFTCTDVKDAFYRSIVGTFYRFGECLYSHFWG